MPTWLIPRSRLIYVGLFKNPPALKTVSMHLKPDEATQLAALLFAHEFGGDSRLYLAGQRAQVLC